MPTTTTPVPAQAPERAATPKSLPRQIRCEVSEITRRVRAAADAAADAPEDVVFDIVISTETPAQRWYGIETLSHAPGAVDLSAVKRGASFYVEHGGPSLAYPDPNLLVGIVEDIYLDEKAHKLRGSVRFQRHDLARRIQQDFEDGSRPYISAGYVVQKTKVTKTAEKYGDKDEVLVTRWKLVEVSTVGIPADPNAVVNRSAGGEEFPVENEEPETPTKESAMPEVPITDPPATTPAAGEPTRETRSGAGGGPSPVVTTDRNAEVAEIFELCAANGMATRAAEFVRKGMSPDSVAREILRERSTRAAAQPPAEAVGVSPKDAKRYSYRRAIQLAAEVREGRRADFDGIEGEIHKELERNTPLMVQRRGGILIPMRLVESDESAREVRAMGSGVAGGGAETVFDARGEFIDLLRNRALVAQFGAQMLTGLTSPVQFPKQTSDPAFQWMRENPASGATATDLGFGLVNLSPKTMIGTVVLPRQLLNIASVDMESRTKLSLAARGALTLDLAGIHGTGTDGQPLGVYHTSGVNAVAFGSAVPTFGKLVDMQGQIGDKNADVSTMAYMTTPLMAARLKQTLVASAAGAGFIWQGNLRDGEVAGYRAGSTGQISKVMSGINATGGSEHGIVFGDWSQLAVGFWGAMELITDVVTLADKGQLKITAFQMGDVAVLRPEAFAISTAALAG